MCLTCLRHGHLRDGEHIFDENAVAPGGVIHQHVGHRANQLSVLDDGTAAHGDVK